MFTAPQMPRDDDGAPIPVLGLRPGGAHRLAVSDVSARVGPFAQTTRVVTVSSDVSIRLDLGDENVTATVDSHHLSAGQGIDLALGGGKRPQKTHLAAIAVDETGVLHISERE